ncbi:hypothetical protein IW152_001962 [Coemansia sp. BCRC 34962]|nr:hypothetical protein IW152_001962 [Coemansia sp. BCRC 34962]
MHFCPSCSNLLLVEPGTGAEGETCLVCQTCPYIYPIRKPIISRTILKRKEVDDVLGGEEAWKNVEAIGAVCPVCRHERAYFKQIQLRSADEPMTSFFKCCNVKCDHGGQQHPTQPKHSINTTEAGYPSTIAHSSANSIHQAKRDSDYKYTYCAPGAISCISRSNGSFVPRAVESQLVSVSPQYSSGKRRKRHHDIASKIRSVQPVPRDEDGKYEMPIQVGVLTVLSLGTVVWDREAYHNERYIWPVGYTVQREYYSMTCPDRHVIYTCWVADGGSGPQFHVEPEDMPGSPVVASTATGAWTAVLRAVNQLIQREHSNSASGPDYFGFSHPTIAKMIQDLPGAERCRAYIMQHFVDMKDRHVRGVIRKGRGGRPSLEMLSRGQRALMASASANQSTLMVDKASGYSESARRISVATLTNEDATATDRLTGPK